MVVKKLSKSNDVEDAVDYAATADEFFNKNNSDEEDDDDEAEGDDDDDDDDDSDGSGDDDDESDDDEDESEVKEGAGAEDRDDAEEAKTTPAAEVKQPVSALGEPCNFDLRNLLATNSHQIDPARLYIKRKGSEEETNVTIPAAPLLRELGTVNEEYLLNKALDGCTQLVEALWQLPRAERKSHESPGYVGPMVQLPARDASRIPRALPPPEPKKETKWEAFARQKGIPLNKNKRSQKVWDEVTGTWQFRHGYNKANEQNKEWPIMEVKPGDDPYADPWEKAREAKRARVEKSREQQMRNLERSGKLAKGTTARILNSREKIREAGKEGGNADRDRVDSVLVLPSGVPVDLKATKTSGPLNSKLRGKASTARALKATQVSTASLGKFDKMRADEPDRPKLGNPKKRRRESDNPTDKKVMKNERERSLKILTSVVEGGGVQKEKDIAKGKYAKGETAYDYEYNDGLGDSTFRKKKGGGGIGKAKKMTKRRMK